MINMYVIASRKASYQEGGITKFKYVSSLSFGDMGWAVEVTKVARKAKAWKTYQGAYNAARKLGFFYDVVQF